ncbi:MAG: hypothetical protein ABW194_04515, partial [Novosphingobium sp.]
LLGADAAREAVRQADPSDADGLARSLADEVQRFEAGTEASDDLTILAIRYRGPGGGATEPAGHRFVTTER